MIERTEKAKSEVISYDTWMSRKTGEIFSLTEHYYTGPDINSTHVGILSINLTDGVSQSKPIMEVVEKCGLEEKIVGIISSVWARLSSLMKIGIKWNKLTILCRFQLYFPDTVRHQELLC